MSLKRKAAIAAGALALVGLAGCAKTIDIQETNATAVPGTSNLYRFCDGPTLIYFSKVVGSDDEYEFIVYGGCQKGVPSQVGVQSLPDGGN